MTIPVGVGVGVVILCWFESLNKCKPPGIGKYSEENMVQKNFYWLPKIIKYL